MIFDVNVLFKLNFSYETFFPSSTIKCTTHAHIHTNIEKDKYICICTDLNTCDRERIRRK